MFEMNRSLWSGLLFTLALTCAGAQEKRELLSTFLRNFEMASLDVKIQILRDAAERPEDLGPLYHQAVEYVLTNTTQIPADQRYQQLALIAAEQIRKRGYREARLSLWRLFETDPDTRIRLNVLNAMGVIARGDPAAIRRIVDWLNNQNTLYATGQQPDLPVIQACVEILGQLGDASSPALPPSMAGVDTAHLLSSLFGALFATVNLGLAEDVTRAAQAALAGLGGNLADHLKEVIRTRPPVLKRRALQAAVRSESLPDERKGEVAEAALTVALQTVAVNAQERAVLREMRFDAARILRDHKRSEATPLAVEHFNQTLLEFDRGISDKLALIDATQFLANMGSHDAAVRLTKYLVLMNSYMEKGQGTDEQVLLALIESLGRLGDKVAFDDLIYIQYLGYSGQIKQAARQAQERLKW
jgi:HEAT repeat protein